MWRGPEAGLPIYSFVLYVVEFYIFLKSTTDDKSSDEKPSSLSGVQQWLDAVAQCTTFSRFNVLMGMLECCIKWEKSAENAVSCEFKYLVMPCMHIIMLNAELILCCLVYL